MSDYKVGDKVRVVIEGEVDYSFGDGDIRVGGTIVCNVTDDTDTTYNIERVLPEFKIGDIVSTNDGMNRYSITGSRSYYSFQMSEEFNDVDLDKEFSHAPQVRVIGNVYEIGQ